MSRSANVEIPLKRCQENDLWAEIAFCIVIDQNAIPVLIPYRQIVLHIS